MNRPNPGASRNAHGAAILLLFVIIIVSLVSCLIAGSEIINYGICRQKASVAAEGASLAAANALSAIVMDDPNFGYVALSDYAPDGSFLLAKDGEALPVKAINTITGTARLDMLIARQINNQEVIKLAELDAKNAYAASLRLTRVLKAAISSRGSVTTDRTGRKVSPREAANNMVKIYLHNCHFEDKMRLKAMDVSLGTLASGGGTITPLPSPLNLAEVNLSQRLGGFYASFKNIPVGSVPYYFVGVGKQSSLVPSQNFVADNGEKPSSILRVELVFEMLGRQSSLPSIIRVVSCSQPFSLADRSNSGTFIVSMPDGVPANLKSIQDFIVDRQLNQDTSIIYSAHEGDYPTDREAFLHPECDANGVTKSLSIANIFATGIYDWIRTAGCKPKLDSLAEALGKPLASQSSDVSQSYYLRINSQGNVETKRDRECEFENPAVQDCQYYSLAVDSLRSQNSLWTLSFRDQVRNLSGNTNNGGKHAGQMMPLTKEEFRETEIIRRSYSEGGLAVELVISSPQI